MSSRRRRALGQPDTVARAVADRRGAHTAEVGQHQLALARSDPGDGVDDLGDELGLVDMEPGLGQALVPEGAHLGHARVIERLRPSPLRSGLARRECRAGLPGVNRRAHAQPAQVHSALARDLHQVERIGGVHTSAVAPRTPSRPAAWASPARRRGSSERRAPGAFEPAQKPMKSPNEKGKKTRSAAVRPAPGARNPSSESTSPTIPGYRASEWACRWSPTSDGRGRIAPPGTSDWSRRGRRRLIGHELRLDERQPGEILPAAQVAGAAEPRRGPLPAKERVAAAGRQDSATQA